MTLLVVSISARAAAESAVRSGYDVMALDAFGDTDLRRACPTFSLPTPSAAPGLAEGSAKVSTTVSLFEASEDLDFDEVVYGSGFENHPECVAEWEKNGKNVLGNSSQSLKWVRDWQTLFDYLDSEGIKHPETTVVKDIGDMGEWNGGSDPGDFLVKPLRSGGGHGIRPLVEVLNSPGFPSDWRGRGGLIQRRIRGTLASLSFIAGKGDFHVLSTTLQLVGSPSSPFRYSGNIAPLSAPPRVKRDMEAAARSIAEEFQLLGSNGVDFVIAGGEAHILEVNPRLQGSLEVVEKSCGISVFDAHVRACRGDSIPVRGKTSPGYWGRRIVFAPWDIRAGHLGELEYVRDVPAPMTLVRQGSPLCTVLAHSPSDGECADLLREREKKVISLSAHVARWSPSSSCSEPPS